MKKHLHSRHSMIQPSSVSDKEMLNVCLLNERIFLVLLRLRSHLANFGPCTATF